LSEITAWDTTHLENAARDWTATAKHWESSFTSIHQAAVAPGGTAWEGAAAEAAQGATLADLVKVRGWADVLHESAAVARHGASTLLHAKQNVLYAVEDAQAAGYSVNEDLSVTPPPEAGEAGEAQAQTYATDIQGRATQLGAHDKEIAGKITTATAPLHQVSFADHPSDDRGDPTIQAVDSHTGPKDPDETARQRDEGIANDPNADPTARRLAQERLDDLKKSNFIGPLPTDPVLGGDARTRADGRRQFQRLLESGEAFPDRAPLTPDQATQLLDQWEANGRQMVLGNFGSQLKAAGVSPPGIQRALDEVRSGKTPWQVFHDVGSGASTWGGALGSGAEAHGRALPGGAHWGDAPVWSGSDAKAMEAFGRKLGAAGIGLDALVTYGDITHGEPWQPAVAEFGGRTIGGVVGGATAGAFWGSFVGPEGTLIMGLLGGIAGAWGGEKFVKLGIGE